jgi:hypothetical protein
MMSVLAKYRSLLRRKLARLKMSSEANHRKIAEVKAELANNAPTPQAIVGTLGLDLSFNRLLATLEQLVIEEQAKYKNQAPSQTDIERWALKSAVLDYYKGLGLQGSTIVVENPTQPKTIHEYAPDTNKVFTIWQQKLADLTKKTDVNQYALPKYDENIERGTPQGGAFEKQLQRYREEFVSEMIKRQSK